MLSRVIKSQTSLLSPTFPSQTSRILYKTTHRHHSTMSSSNEAQKNPTIGQEEQHNPPLPLPAPSSTDATKIDMSGGSAEAKLDHLGPLVVNSDGTLSRIANWEQMTEIERKNTLRVLGKRNKERMEALQGAEGAKGGT